MKNPTKEQIAMHVVYRAKFCLNGEIYTSFSNDDGIIKAHNGKESRLMDWDKIMLRDLSQLTQPIRHKGETFVPLEYLRKITYNKRIFQTLQGISSEIDKIESSGREDFIIIYMKIRNVLPFYLMEKLLEWQFNVFGIECVEIGGGDGGRLL